MKKIHILCLSLLFALALPLQASESTPASEAVSARAKVLSSALKMLSTENASTYPEILAQGIQVLAKQMDQIEDVIDDIDDEEIAAAEAKLPQTANFASLASQFRNQKASLSASNYYNCPALIDAIDDLMDEIEDMED